MGLLIDWILAALAKGGEEEPSEDPIKEDIEKEMEKEKLRFFLE